MIRRDAVPGRAALAAVGAHGLVVQVVLLRGLMAAHGGNELSAGLALGVWVAAQALGALAAGRGDGRSPAGWLAAAALGPVVAVAAAPLTRSLLGLGAGEAAGLPGLGLAALAVAAVPAFCHGGLFVAGSTRLCRGDERMLGTGYAWAGAGAVVAGPLTWLVLLESVSGVALVAGAGALLATAMLPTLSRGPGRSLVSVLVVALAAAGLLGHRVELAAWQRSWAGQRLVAARDSRYGKVLRLERSGQATVVRDAGAIFRFPAADPLADEQLALVPLLAVPGARRVLVCGPGFELVSALLAGSLGEVAVVEPDRALFVEVLAAAGSGAGWTSDPRFSIVHEDPRRLLARPGPGWDIIFVAGDAPASLAGSRLFSVEFYRLCRTRLNPGGLLVMAGPGGPGSGLAVTGELLATRLAGLGQAFPHAQLLMLDFPLFLAGDSVPAIVPARAGLLDSAALAGLLDPFRQAAAGMDSLARSSARPATDAMPRELFLNLARENRARSGQRGGWYRAAGRVPVAALPALAAGVLALALVLALVGRRGTAGARWTARFGLPVATSGLAGAGLTVLGVFVYQARFGSVYSGVSLLLTAFLAGTALGGWLGNRAAGNRRHADQLVTVAEFALATAALALVALSKSGPAPLFFALMFLGGAAVGCQFTPATAARAGGIGRRLGLVTGLDLTGGFAGAVLVAGLLVPAFGLAAAAAGLAALKLASLTGRLAAGRAIDTPGAGV